MNYMEMRIDLNLVGKQLSTKTGIQSFGRVLFLNRNFSLYVDTVRFFER